MSALPKQFQDFFRLRGTSAIRSRIFRQTAFIMNIDSKQLAQVQKGLGGLLLLSLTGCVTSYEDQALRKVYEQHTDSIVKSCAKADAFEAKDAADRNVKLRKLIYLVDRHYENW